MPIAKRTGKYRSKFESTIAAAAKLAGVSVTYEPKNRRVKWQPKPRMYLPDFEIKKTKVLVEAKGRLTPADRAKLIAVKQQNPTLDLRLVFQRNNTISRASTTRYSEWAEKNGFQWAIGAIPLEWTVKTAGTRRRR